MTIESRIKLVPFRVPDFVLTYTSPSSRQNGFRDAPKFALSELDAATLDLLCDQFREDVFKKAGIKDPNVRG